MTSQHQRRYDLDAIRIFAVLTIFFFHCARFFDPFGWHLKNAETSTVVSVFVGFISMWSMPLFFLISGVGTWYGLGARTPGQYLIERVKRLLIPFFTVGLFLLLPPQYFFELTTNRGFAGSFAESYALYFAHIFIDNGPSAFYCTVWSGHLWFLQQLFLVSLFTLPLLICLKSDSGRVKIRRLAAMSDRAGGIFLLVIPIAVISVCLQWIPQKQEHGWPNFFNYTAFFLIGYVISTDNQFLESIEKSGWIGMFSGIVAFLVAALLVLKGGYDPAGVSSISWAYLCFQVAASMGALSWIVFFLSLAAKYLNHKSKTIAYGNEAVLPFYILHQTIILMVGWFIIQSKLSIALKYVIICIISFVLIIALYEFLIKRINALRFLFGMRPKSALH
ncbi:MAG: acyltransferase family protein [Planctomycetes bacterium]|nr:acyltransferase family protein [Planctomycetota bacterium]MBL7188570.1 acyltransferase family protein [Phycisphaerae bacterium]